LLAKEELDYDEIDEIFKSLKKEKFEGSRELYALANPKSSQP